MLFLILFSGCSSNKRYMIAMPWARGIPHYAKDNDWQKGFDDACNTMTAIGAAGWFRSMPTKIDGWKLTGKSPDVKDGALYYAGFKQGREHCFYELDWNAN